MSIEKIEFWAISLFFCYNWSTMLVHHFVLQSNLWVLVSVILLSPPSLSFSMASPCQWYYKLNSFASLNKDFYKFLSVVLFLPSLPEGPLSCNPFPFGVTPSSGGSMWEGAWPLCSDHWQSDGVSWLETQMAGRLVSPAAHTFPVYFCSLRQKWDPLLRPLPAC